MTTEDLEYEKSQALQLFRQALKGRNLSQLRQGFEKPWAKAIVRKYQKSQPNANFRIFRLALEDLTREERKRAFTWTWECYHPLMSDLAAALEDLDGRRRIV